MNMKINLALALSLFLPSGVSAAGNSGFVTCVEQSKCLSVKATESCPSSPCGSGSCEYRVCLTLELNGECAKKDAISHTCTFADQCLTTDSVPSKIETENDPKLSDQAEYCYTVGAGETATWILKDSNTDSPEAVATYTLAGGESLECATLGNTDATSCGGDQVNMERVWTWTAPPASECSCSDGGASGDPHIKSWSGENYDFHGVCDLVLLQNHGFGDGVGMDIHIRTKQTRQWSYVSSAVVRIGRDTFEVAGGKAEDTYWINGVAGTEDLGKEALLSHTIGGYPISFTRTNSKQREYVIALGNDQAVVLKTWNDFVRVDIRGATRDNFGDSLGLMGTFPEGAHMARDNASVIDDNNAFGQEWQVLASEPMLFHNVDGPQAPAKCVIPSATVMRRRLGETVISQKDAEIACARIAVEDRDLCIFDVMATNDRNVAGAY